MDTFVQPVITGPMLAFPSDAQANSLTVLLSSQLNVDVHGSSPFHLHPSRLRQERGEFCFSRVVSFCRQPFSQVKGTSPSPK